MMLLAVKCHGSAGSYENLVSCAKLSCGSQTICAHLTKVYTVVALLIVGLEGDWSSTLSV